MRKRFGSQGRGSTQSSMKLMTYSNGLELTLVSSSFAIVWRSSYATVRLQFGSSLYIGFPEALFESGNHSFARKTFPRATPCCRVGSTKLFILDLKAEFIDQQLTLLEVSCIV